jgi:hypothetical protein
MLSALIKIIPGASRMSPSTPSETDPVDRNTEIALFRYGLIAQLVHTPPDSGQQESLLRDIAARTYIIPGSTRTRVSLTTLRRYLKSYVAHGFDALRPVARADAGASRVISPEVLTQAIALREEQPARTTQTIVDILQRDPQLTLGQPINVHTLTTQLRQRGKTRRLLHQSAKAYRRFEREHPNSLWQADEMFGPWLPDPDVPGRKRRTHLFGFLDDHSRLVPHAEFFCPCPRSPGAGWAGASRRPCRGWNACSKSRSCAAVCRRRSTSTMARSIPRCNSRRPAPHWAFNGLRPRPMRPKAKASRSDFG